uniref:Ribosomal protein S11 n=1 Tax=Cymbomonas tetramitiformis TaxID=36881 RepID=A0A1S5R1Y1_9CHLO|nr:ribosomal protein S11 [Cymbomonas tetramitiformis]ANA57087.1 ribosomal protein S11 [Cymbomonas tetramitiformis]
MKKLTLKPRKVAQRLQQGSVATGNTDKKQETRNNFSQDRRKIVSPKSAEKLSVSRPQASVASLSQNCQSEDLGKIVTVATGKPGRLQSNPSGSFQRPRNNKQQTTNKNTRASQDRRKIVSLKTAGERSEFVPKLSVSRPQTPVCSYQSQDRRRPRVLVSPKTADSAPVLKPKKNYFIHIHTTFNNTLINVTNFKGDTIAWASGGSIGFKNSRKKGSFVARQVGYALGRKCRKKKIKHVQVKVKGLGYSKKNAIRGIKSSGIKIKEIHEITGIPYNGCRLRKKRR